MYQEYALSVGISLLHDLLLIKEHHDVAIIFPSIVVDIQ